MTVRRLESVLVPWLVTSDQSACNKECVYGYCTLVVNSDQSDCLIGGV